MNERKKPNNFHSQQAFDVLVSLEEQKKTQNFWNISWEVGEFLHDIISHSSAKTILEIGTSSAFSTLWFADAVRVNKGKVYTVESSPKRQPIAQDSIQKSGFDHIHLITGHAPECILLAEIGMIDIAFFDATKMEYIAYFETIFPSLNEGGFIIADNVTSHAEELADYLQRVRNHPECESIFFPLGTGLEITRKKPIHKEKSHKFSSLQSSKK